MNASAKFCFKYVPFVAIAMSVSQFFWWLEGGTLPVQRTFLVAGGIIVPAICTTKSELEFNILSARRYVSMAQRNVRWGGD